MQVLLPFCIIHNTKNYTKVLKKNYLSNIQKCIKYIFITVRINTALHYKQTLHNSHQYTSLSHLLQGSFQ